VYEAAKSKTPESICLFRVGDFYELFYDDAQTAAAALGLTLTTRNKGGEKPIPMAGFPYHQLEHYLRRLNHTGRSVAVLEQVR
jgi:DNA mismatch repair protein MutS